MASSAFAALLCLAAVLTAAAGPPEGKGGGPPDGKGGKPSDKGGGKPSGKGNQKELRDDSTGISVRVLGQSGKIVLGADSEDDADKVTIAMSSIVERNAAGERIGQSGPNDGKHSRSTFANTDFAFSAPYDIDVSGVPATAIDFDVALVNGIADLSISALLFTANGTITPTPFEEHDVGPGSLKFNVQLANWPFCDGEDGNPCQGATGAFVDIGIEVTSRAHAALAASEAANHTYSLGDGAELVLSDAVQLDGEWTVLPEGYPALSAEGDKYELTLRIPRFSEKALYDPIVREEAAPSASGGLSRLAWWGIGAGIVVALICACAVAVDCVYDFRGKRSTGQQQMA